MPVRDSSLYSPCNKAIICGGHSPLSKCYIYDTIENEWTYLCGMTTPRYRHAVTKFGTENKFLWVTGKYMFLFFNFTFKGQDISKANSAIFI